MPTSLILTLIGEDRPGLVDSVSGILTDHQANWEESRMASLGGKFAGILLATVAEAKAAQLTEALYNLEADGLKVVVERCAASVPSQKFRTLQLELVGQDHPGIIHDISHALATHRVNVEELSTEVSHASMAGGDLFKAQATLHVPLDVDDSALRDALESLANEIMVDLSLDDL